jgi:hypothetical protein
MPTAVNQTILDDDSKSEASPGYATVHADTPLCNVIYELSSKVLANWLCMVLSEIFAEEESAFVSDKLILYLIMC